MTDIGDGQAPAGAENAGWRHAEKVGLTDAEIVRAWIDPRLGSTARTT